MVDPELDANLKKTAASLTQDFQRELEQLEKLQTAAEDRRIQAEEKNQKNLLSEILATHGAAEKQRKARRLFLVKFILGPTGMLSLIIGGVLGYFKVTAPPETNASDVKASVEKSEAAVTKTIEKKIEDIEHATEHKIEIIEQATSLNNKKIERLVDIQLDQQVLWSEASDYIVDKIEKAHPKTKSVKEPESVTEGRIRAAAIKAKRKSDYDPTDPLADIRND